MNDKPDTTKREQRANRAGTVHRFAPAKPGECHGHYVVRCSAPDGSRPLFHLDPSPKSPQARARALETAAAITERLHTEGLGAAPVRPRAARPGVATTGDVKSDPAAWWQAFLALRSDLGLTSVGGFVETHIRPVIATHPSDWTRDDVKRLRDELDAKMMRPDPSDPERMLGTHSSKSCANYWTVFTTACKAASGRWTKDKRETLKVREDNPAEGVAPPDRLDDRETTWIYPNEFLKLVSCEAVPLAWRRIYAIAAYTFVRASELQVLRWTDIDIDHGVIRVHRGYDRERQREKDTKTGRGGRREFAIEPNLLPLLRAMHEESGGVGRVAAMPHLHRASGVREYLKLAGVTRARLFETTTTQKRATFHSLRNTGLTWAAIRGDSAFSIERRAGHVNMGTTDGYVKEAQLLGDALGEMFPPLPTSLFKQWQLGGTEGELSQKLSQNAPSVRDHGSSSWTRTRDPAVNSRLLYRLS